jgi:hypothetical protein
MGPTMRRPSVRSAGSLVALALIAAGALVSGCGGDDGESIATATNDDRLALEKVTSQIEQAAKDGDAEAFCGLVQPSLMQKAFGGRKACVRVSRSAMQPASPLTDLEITDIVTDGDGAIVTYSEDPPGQVLFARENGNWYIALDELARARTEALEKQGRNGNQNQGGGQSGPQPG